MEPHEWKYAIERLQRHMDPHLQEAPYNSNSGWDTYREYPGGQSESEPHGSSSTGWTDRPCQEVYSEDTEDPDGEPLETPGEGEELESKMKKLRQIEEQILHKKASLAIKTIGLVAKDTTSPPIVFCSEQADGTLRDRVRTILLQHPHSFLSQVQDRSPTERSSSSRQQELHPLQLRVKALMKQRCSAVRELPANCEQDADDVPSQTEEGTSQHQGFQRFLSVLNKGVDIDMLRRIVSDDRDDLPLSEEVLNVQPSGASLPDEHKETKTEEKKDERRERPQPESPPVVKKTKRQEEEEQPKVDERREQLQNVLKSLGLSLELEEMSRLADRTQERLYGKKTEQRLRRGSSSEQEGDNRGSHMEHSKSSCSSSSSSSSCSSSRSSSSSSSRSSSRSCSPSPSRRPHSRKHRSPEERGSGHTNCETYQHPYLQNQTLPHPHSAASVFPDYSLSQYPCYPHSASYNAAPYSHWSYTVNPGGHPYTPHHVYPGSAVTPTVFYQYPTAFHDVVESGINPDLCESEGQTGSASGSHCLTVIGQKLISSRISERETAQTNRARNRKKKQKKAQKKSLAEHRRTLMEVAEQKTQAEQGEAKKTKKKKKQPPQPEEEALQKQQPAKEEEKRPLTEEEIKANLREKLEAFNQKMKSSRQLQHFAAMQPPHSLSSEIS